MEWFTRDWHTGGLSDEEWERRAHDYSAHASALQSQLPADQHWLLELDLHDAQVQSWQLGDEGFRLVLLTGDLQRGYRLTTVAYSDAALVGVTLEELDELGLTEGCELLSDEVVRAGDKLEHRFIFEPRGEFGVRFSSASVRYAQADPTLRR